MSELIVGVRDLKARLSEYLRRVRSGQALVVTDHGQVVARLLPAEQPLEERLRSLQEAGLLAWNGHTLPPLEPPAVNRGQRSLSELLVEMRQ